MGSANAAQCLECGKAFTVSHGSGFFFHLLRCGECGRTRAIGFDELGDLHLRYLKGSLPLGEIRGRPRADSVRLSRLADTDML